MPPKPDWRRRSTESLLSDWAAIMHELRRRETIRSGNSPTGDLAEGLVAAHFGAKLEGNSNAGFDLRHRGKRIQVKCRRWTEKSKPSHYGVMRNLDKDPFDVLIVVHFDELFAPTAAYRMTIATVRELATYYPHTNGWRLGIIRSDRTRPQGVKILDLRP